MQNRSPMMGQSMIRCEQRDFGCFGSTLRSGRFDRRRRAASATASGADERHWPVQSLGDGKRRTSRVVALRRW
jgi:hypothetical protein